MTPKAPYAYWTRQLLHEFLIHQAVDFGGPGDRVVVGDAPLGSGGRGVVMGAVWGRAVRRRALLVLA